MTPNAPTGVDHGRRGLARLLGAGLAPALPGAALAAPTEAAPVAAVRVGVVLPRSAHQPRLPADFLEGLRGGLAGSGAPVVEPIVAEYDGARPRDGLARARELLEHRDLALVTGVLDPEAARELRPALRAHARVLLVCDLGANVPRADADAAGIARASLHAWRAEHAAGIEAARKLGRRGALAVGWRESGYDLPYAFRHGFAEAGGVIVAEQIDRGPDGAGDFDALSARVRALRPDFVRALYSGDDAAAFARRYRDAGLQRIAPLVGGAWFQPDASAPAAFGRLGQLAGTRIGRALDAARRGAPLAVALAEAPAPLDPAARRLAATLARRPRSGWLYPYLSA